MDTSPHPPPPPPPRGRFLDHPSRRKQEPPPRGRFLLVPRTLIRDPPKPSPPPPPSQLSPSDDQNTIKKKKEEKSVLPPTPPPPTDPSPLQPVDEKKATPSLVDLKTVVSPSPPKNKEEKTNKKKEEKSALPPPPPHTDPIPLQPLAEKYTPPDVQNTVDLPPTLPTTEPIPLQPVVDDEKPAPSDDDQKINDLLPQYDAFISFRGADVRDLFLSHLFDYMNNQKKILTYKDDVNLKRGDQITPSLLEAIERSSSYVVIFSPNYATSKWCLEELVKILECTEKYGRKMIPVFHGGVAPTHVRHTERSTKEEDKNSYYDAFVEHENNKVDEAKIARWRAALKKAADISGFDSQVTKPESHLVQEVTKRILEAIKPNSSIVTEGLVGIESEIEAVEKLLETDDSQKTRVIGFWGMPGIGKTTLADAIFHEIDTDKFERRHYIPDFAAKLKSNTVMDLQNQLFKDLLRDDNPQDIAFKMKLTRLRRLKVFVIVDDVTTESIQPLEELLMHISFRDLFGPGSRMILTSTNRQVLKVNGCEEQEKHEVLGLDEEKALKLFSFYAFKKDQPPAEYKEMCDKVVGYCGGNPMALKVLGVMFYDRERRFWDGKVEKLRTLDNKKIRDLLMISYNELSRDEQSAFLDIACFFNHEDYEFVTRVLDEDLVTHLVGKSLVKINYSKREIEMHSLLEDLGRFIVQEEKMLGRRSRLWEAKDALNLLAENMGTEATEGILLKLTKKEEEIETEYSDTFAKMRNLRLLSIELPPDSKVVFPNGEGLVNTLRDELRYLRWDLFAATSLPSKFTPKNLRVLRLKHNSIRQLWEGTNIDLGNLKELNLMGSKYLTEVPDLSTAEKLELVDLTSCAQLLRLHNSIISIPSLKTLILDSCKALNLSNLDEEDKQGSTVACFPSLEQVNLDATPIEKVPRLLLRAPNLTQIDCSSCPNLSKFPSIDTLSIKHLIFRNNKRLVDFPVGGKMIHMLKSLETLDLYGCENLHSFPEIATTTTMEGLQVLDLSYCSKISRIPDTIRNLVNLERLHLTGTGIKELPPSILTLKRLTVLKFDECKKLVKIPRNFKELTRLETMAMAGCDALGKEVHEFPDRVEFL